MRTLLATLALVLALAAPAAAQSTTTAIRTANGTITFTASADHAVVIGGLSLVTDYDVSVLNGTTTIATIALGKPTPAATTNVITAPLSSSGLPKNTVLTAIVTATGAGGSTGSAPSNPFAFLVAPGAAGSVTVR